MAICTRAPSARLTSTTIIHTRTRHSAAAVLSIERAGGGHAITGLRRGARIAPRILRRGATVHASFVPTQAGPLAGDHDVAQIAVGRGARLLVEPVAATVALPGSARTVLELEVTIQAGGRLVLDEAPLVVAAGADVTRRTKLELERGAVAAIREVVVLGRQGEEPGALDSSLRVTLGTSALLHDALRLGGVSPRGHRHVALPPGHRIISTACLLGIRPGEDRAEPAVMGLHGPGAVMRGTGVSLAAVEAATAEVWRAWSRAASRVPAGLLSSPS